MAVDTAGVSGWDLKYRRGLQPGTKLPGRNPFPMPQQLGREAAGTVVATAPDTRLLHVGDRVAAVVHPENPYAAETYRGIGEPLRRYRHPRPPGPGRLRRVCGARRAALPAGARPRRHGTAAVTLWPYGTSHRVLRDRLRVTAGDTLLVTGAADPMGLATIQLAQFFGLRVIATTRHAERADALRTAAPRWSSPATSTPPGTPYGTSPTARASTTQSTTPPTATSCVWPWTCCVLGGQALPGGR
ncbi:alcohol dehydrogenase catalytic domain-containing protein [Streptomyces sp. NPDC006285]|uniref:alcohol dehydrogenase catalytic domain-containing protein n=1 Tax=Streptomyces sp. NPDC006285 TaxID=3364742 RepID=UPI0036934692